MIHMKKVFLFLGIIFVSFYSVYGQKDYKIEAQKRFNQANDLASKGMITAAIQKYNAAKILAENDLALQIKIDNAIANVFNDLDNRLTIAQLDELRASIASQQASAMSNLFSLYTSYQPEITKLTFTDSLRRNLNKQTQQSISQINNIIKDKKVTGELQNKVELVKQLAIGTSFKNKLDTLLTEIFNNSYVHQFRQQHFSGTQNYKLREKNTSINFLKNFISYPQSAPKGTVTEKKKIIPKPLLDWQEYWRVPNAQDFFIYLDKQENIDEDSKLIGSPIKIGNKTLYVKGYLDFEPTSKLGFHEKNYNQTENLLLEYDSLNNPNITIRQLLVKALANKKLLATFPNTIKHRVSPDGKWLVLLLPNHKAQLIHTQNFTAEDLLSNEEIDDCVFSSDSQWLICRDKVFDTSFWQLTTNEKIVTPIYIGKTNLHLSQLPNKQYLLIHEGKNVSFLNIENTDVNIKTVWNTKQLSLSPDSLWFAYSFYKKVFINSLSQNVMPYVHYKFADSLSFLPDKSSLVLISNKNVVDTIQLAKLSLKPLPAPKQSSWKVEFKQHTIQIQNDAGETIQTIYSSKTFEEKEKPEYYILNNRFFFVVLGKSLIKTDLQRQRGTLFTYGDGTKFNYTLNDIEEIKDLFKQ